MKSGRDILDAQYKAGRATVDRADWARDTFASLRQRCPHVPEEELVRLFHDRGPSQLELIIGDAIFREYNASHPLGRKRVKVRPKRVLAPPPVAAMPKPAAKAPAKKAPAKPAKPAPKAKAKPPARKSTVKPKRKRR